jgi:hypothetical protein
MRHKMFTLVIGGVGVALLISAYQSSFTQHCLPCFMAKVVGAAIMFTILMPKGRSP